MTPTPFLLHPFTVGQRVAIWKYGLHYTGTITLVGRTRVKVKFTALNGKDKEMYFPMEGLGAPEAVR